ncbi:MAG: UTP--glucose-1-phosphate uridylyltransferase GalU [Candidatus Symbiodolus clandestinus]
MTAITISKAVIPVAGLGTRMLPATKAVPKEMLPLVDKPLIQYVVHECINAGIKQIVLVTHASKNSIENHFDTSFELEAALEKRVKRQLLAEIAAICPEEVTIMPIRQGLAKGLGHAILCAQPIVGNQPFVVILPDVIMAPEPTIPSMTNLSSMCQRFVDSGLAQVMVEEVALDCVTQYGIVDCGGAMIPPGGSVRIRHIVEKPSPKTAPSQLAVVGRYVFPAAIWRLLARVTPDQHQEIQLTDAIVKLLAEQPVEAYRLLGGSYDCGNKLGYMQAFVEYGLQHEVLGKPFKDWLDQRVASTGR